MTMITVVMNYDYHTLPARKISDSGEFGYNKLLLLPGANTAARRLLL